MDRDLNDVHVFTKVVEAGSFTGAAKGLHLPVSSVSRRVARLEEELGVRLLTRTTRKLSLTEAGTLYFERSVRVLAELDEAESILSKARSTPRGRVRVAAPPEHDILMVLVNELMAKHAELRIELDFTSRVVNILEEGYDVAVVAGPPRSQSVVAHKLMDSPFVIVGSPAYLKKRGKPRRVSDLTDHAAVIFGPSSANAHWTLETSSGAQRVPVRGRFAANHLFAVRDAVLAGHGLALLPRLACARALDRGDLVAVLPKASPPPVSIHVTYAAGRLLPAAVRVFVEHLRERFADEAACMGQRRRRRAKG